MRRKEIKYKGRLLRHITNIKCLRSQLIENCMVNFWKKNYYRFLLESAMNLCQTTKYYRNLNKNGARQTSYQYCSPECNHKVEKNKMASDCLRTTENA